MHILLQNYFNNLGIFKNKPHYSTGITKYNYLHTVLNLINLNRLMKIEFQSTIKEPGNFRISSATKELHFYQVLTKYFLRTFFKAGFH